MKSSGVVLVVHPTGKAWSKVPVLGAALPATHMYLLLE